MGRWLALLILLVGLSGPARAVTLLAASATSGTLATAQTATGVSTNAVDTWQRKHWRSIVFVFVTSAGTATIRVEAQCDGTNWQIVGSSSTALDIAGVATDGVAIELPLCTYRTNITACSSCDVTVTYRAGARVRGGR